VRNAAPDHAAEKLGRPEPSFASLPRLDTSQVLIHAEAVRVIPVAGHVFRAVTPYCPMMRNDH
jgi:hypothetical protein